MRAVSKKTHKSQTAKGASKTPAPKLSQKEPLTKSEKALEDGMGFYRTKPGKMGRPRLPIATMPMFDSLAQCSAATGVPVTALKMAKANGCQAFRSTRVDFGGFIRWWFGAKVDSVDWSKELKKEQTLRERIKREEDQRESINFGKVSRFLQTLVGQHFFGELERMSQEWPPVLKGLDERAIHAAIVDQVERMKVNLRSQLVPWARKDQGTKGKKRGD